MSGSGGTQESLPGGGRVVDALSPSLSRAFLNAQPRYDSDPAWQASVERLIGLRKQELADLKTQFPGARVAERETAAGSLPLRARPRPTQRHHRLPLTSCLASAPLSPCLRHAHPGAAGVADGQRAGVAA